MGKSTMNEKYNSLRSTSTNFCLEAAISEFIDNSIQSIVNDLSKKLYKNSDHCDKIYNILENENSNDRDFIINELKKYDLTVSIDTKESTYKNGQHLYIIQIKDNACGIPFENIVQCMKKGETLTVNQGKIKNSMNNYGVGLKIACFYLGKNAKIYSKPKDQKFISFGDYDSPLDDTDPRVSEDVLIIDEKIKKGDPNFDIIKDHGTIIEIYSLDKKYFDILQKVKDKGNINFSLTIGMKYSKYIESGILKLQIEKNGNIIKKIEHENLFTTSKETKYSPFKIKEYFKSKKEILSETKNINSVEDFQAYLKQEMLKIEDKKFKEIYENSISLQNVFDNTDDTLCFTVNHKFFGRNLPVKVGVMSEGKQQFSYVNVLSQWRYINLPCLNNEKNLIVSQWRIQDTDWKDPTSARWTFFEFNLIDLEGNENYEYFVPERNKISFIENQDTILDEKERKQITKANLAESLVNLKKALGPFTDIFKDLEKSTALKNVPKKFNDTFELNITPNPKTNSISYEKEEGKTSLIKYNNNEVEEAEFVRSINDTEVEINTRSKYFPISNNFEPNWIILMSELQKYISKNLELLKLISNDLNVEQAPNYDKILPILEELKQIEKPEDLLKKGKDNE